MRGWLILVPILATARLTHADPVALAIDATDLAAATTGFVEQHDEPVGLLAVEANPKLGLDKGDIVRAIDGQSATRVSMLTQGGAILYLDVLRGTQTVLVRVAVKLDEAEITIPRDRYKDRIQQLQRFGVDLISKGSHVFTQVTKGTTPSGVMVQSLWFGFGTLLEGDVIRKIDGLDIATTEEAIEALARAKDHNEIAITVERLDQTLVRTLKIEDTLNPDPAIAGAGGGMLISDASDVIADPSASCARHESAVQPAISWSLGIENADRSTPVAKHSVVAARAMTIMTPEMILATELGSVLGSSDHSHPYKRNLH